jgi:hypothetical protein
MQNYIDEISQGSTPMTLISVDEYEQQMKDAGCSPNQIAQVKAALAYAKRSNKQIPAFFVPRVGIFAFIENIPNIEQLRLTYIHERQHQFTAANKAYLNALLQLGLSRERMAEIVFALSDSDFYKNDTAEALADEIISYAMERAYTYEDFSVALRELGIEQEIIDIITNIDNEQRSDNTTYPSRRRRGYDLHDNSGRQGNRTENDRNQESISGGLLDEQRDRSLGLGDRRTGSGEEGAESGEVASEEGPSFRVTSEMDEAYLRAVEAGDMETAQRMVIEAAKLAMPNTKVVDENGEPMVMYHGTGKEYGFTIFNTNPDNQNLGSHLVQRKRQGCLIQKVITPMRYSLTFKTLGLQVLRTSGPMTRKHTLLL